jgi:type IV secretion system protein VirB8
MKGLSIMAGAKDSALASYFSQGEIWEHEIIKTAKRSRAFAWLVALIMSVIAVSCLIAILMMIPLQKFEPYIVVVDKTTGFMEVKSGLTRPARLTEQEAVTQANVARYIRARESYDPYRIEDNFGLAAILSTDDAARDLQREYSSSNPDNPAKKYGRLTEIRVAIKSITFPNTTTAIVRFSTLEKTDANSIERHFISVVRFRYTDVPAANEWRFENPLGFQTYNYRRDQETVTTEPQG